MKCGVKLIIQYQISPLKFGNKHVISSLYKYLPMMGLKLIHTCISKGPRHGLLFWGRFRTLKVRSLNLTCEAFSQNVNYNRNNTPIMSDLCTFIGSLCHSLSRHLEGSPVQVRHTWHKSGKMPKIHHFTFQMIQLFCSDKIESPS